LFNNFYSQIIYLIYLSFKIISKYFSYIYLILFIYLIYSNQNESILVFYFNHFQSFFNQLVYPIDLYLSYFLNLGIFIFSMIFMFYFLKFIHQPAGFNYENDEIASKQVHFLLVLYIFELEIYLSLIYHHII